MNILNKETALSRMIAATKGNRHAYYERVNSLADLYLKLTTGEDIESLLIQFGPREPDEMFKQRKRITKTIVGAVSGKVKGPFEKVSRSNNVTKKIMFSGDDKKTQIDKLEKTLDGFWGDESLDQYMQQRLIDLSFSDPNSFIVIESQEVDGQKRIYPFEVSSQKAIDYHYTNNSLDYLIVKEGKKFTMYTSAFTTVFVEVKDDEDKDQKDVKIKGKMITDLEQAASVEGETYLKVEKKTYNVWVIDRDCQQIPAIRVGYKRDEMTEGNTYVSPMHKAVNRMLKIVKSDSELDLVISLHAFPQKLQYAQRCAGDVANGQICENGKIRKSGDTCTHCKGTGWIFHTNAASVLTYELPPQDELNQGAQIPPLDSLIAYKHPPIDIIEFENKYTRQLEDEVLKDIFISQNFERSNGVATATEIDFDMQSIYDTLYPFARKYSAVYKKIVNISACETNVNNGLTVIHQFPKDFKFKTVSQLLDELQKADTANAPEFFKKQINHDIAAKIWHDDPIALKKYNVKQQHMPFSGKSKDEIRDIIVSGRSTKATIMLWIEFENIMQMLEDEYMEKVEEMETIEPTTPLSFYDLPYRERVQLIKEKVAELLEEKANETSISPLDMGAGSDNEDTDEDDQEEEEEIDDNEEDPEE